MSPFTHRCCVCRRWGAYGYSPTTKKAQDATWWCRDHVPAELREGFGIA